MCGSKNKIFAVRGAELIISASLTSITFVGRTLGHAIIGASKVSSLGIGGTLARAAGFGLDFRAQNNCSGGAEEIICAPSGDSFSRIALRIEETRNSVFCVFSKAGKKKNFLATDLTIEILVGCFLVLCGGVGFGVVGFISEQIEVPKGYLSVTLFSLFSFQRVRIHSSDSASMSSAGAILLGAGIQELVA